MIHFYRTHNYVHLSQDLTFEGLTCSYGQEERLVPKDLDLLEGCVSPTSYV